MRNARRVTMLPMDHALHLVAGLIRSKASTKKVRQEYLSLMSPDLTKEELEKLVERLFDSYSQAALVIAESIEVSSYFKRQTATAQIQGQYLVHRLSKYGTRKVTPKENRELMKFAINMLWDTPLVRDHRKWLLRENDDAKVTKWRDDLIASGGDVWKGYTRKFKEIEKKAQKIYRDTLRADFPNLMNSTS